MTFTGGLEDAISQENMFLMLFSLSIFSILSNLNNE